MATKRKVLLLWFCVAVYLLPLTQAEETNGDKGNSNTGDVASNGTHAVVNTDTHDVVEKVKDLKVKVLLEDPYVMVSRTDPRQYEGMFIDILNDITHRANLTYTITAQTDGIYGYEYAPGNWTGLVGSLQTGDAHLAVAPLTIVSKRQAVVDYSLPVMSAGLRILYKVPDPWSDSEAFAILLSPFTAGLWVVLLLMFISVSILFYVIGRFSPYEDPAFVGKAATYEGLTLVNSFLYVFSSMTFQGYTAAPRSMAGRVLAAFWWMFVLLVIAAYAASLCAIFLAYKPSINQIPFATFDELSKQTDVAYGVVKDGSTQAYLQRSNRPLQQRLWATISSHGDNWLVTNVREGMYRVQKSNGKFALIMEGPMAEYLSEQPPCELMTVGEELSEHAYGFACKKNTDVCTNINQAILQIQEEDVIFDLKKKWLHKGCNRDDVGEYIFQGLAYFDTFGGQHSYYAKRTITLRRFGTGFLLLFIGMVLSAALLLGEIFYAKRRGTAVPQRMPRGMEDQERIDREYRDEDA